MSYDSDFEKMFMVQFDSGRTIYVTHYTTQDVIEYCADEHPNDKIVSIYKEMYVGEEFA